MTGLLLKDIFVLRKAAKTYLFMLLFYMFLSVIGAFDNSMVSGFIALFTMMLPLSCFSYDEVARWDKFAAALPVGRRTVVGARYLLVLCLGALAMTLLLVFNLILWVLKGGVLGDMLLTGLVCVAIGLLMNSFLLPLLFKFGAEKGRLFTMAVAAVLFLLGIGGAKLLDGTSGVAVPLWAETLLPVASFLIVSAALFLSYHISLGIFQKKEL